MQYKIKSRRKSFHFFFCGIFILQNIYENEFCRQQTAFRGGGKENFVSAYYCTLVCPYAPFTQQSGYLVSTKAALVCLSKAGER